MGGTWDLFRYPGIRSDSDMFTLGYSFRPWRSSKPISDGESILTYIRETASEHGLYDRIRVGHKVIRAEWSSADAVWTVHVSRAEGTSFLRARFVFSCAGYYDYEAGYLPKLPSIDEYTGAFFHAQSWPKEMSALGKRVTVIGSGATAVTLVPELAKSAAHVTMLQRTPSYVVSVPSTDWFADRARRTLPPMLSHAVSRWYFILLGIAFYTFSKMAPNVVSRVIKSMIKKTMGPNFATEKHFSPPYKPFDQRVCLVPDADLFKALSGGRAEIITDEIAFFEQNGPRLKSGRLIPADIVVAATGLSLKVLGGIELAVDGKSVDVSQRLTYRGCMLSGVPNFAWAFGYTNASWTLKAELSCRYVCRLLNEMKRRGALYAVPNPSDKVQKKPLLEFTSGYVQRSIAILPKQGDRGAWQVRQNYFLDMLDHYIRRTDDDIEFIPNARSKSL